MLPGNHSSSLSLTLLHNYFTFLFYPQTHNSFPVMTLNFFTKKTETIKKRTSMEYPPSHLPVSKRLYSAFLSVSLSMLYPKSIHSLVHLIPFPLTTHPFSNFCLSHMFLCSRPEHSHLYQSISHLK